MQKDETAPPPATTVWAEAPAPRRYAGPLVVGLLVSGVAGVTAGVLGFELGSEVTRLRHTPTHVDPGLHSFPRERLPASLRPPAPAPVALPPAPPAPATLPLQGQGPRVELAFVVDTTASMGGLLRAAREKVWSIVNQLADARPRPRIALGLVAFRDHGDAYVTRAVPFTEDLDAFYAGLQALTPVGGGDDPEAVQEALATALDELRWTAAEAPATARFLFLVGDAPPRPGTEPGCQALAAMARARGVSLHAVQCGADPGARAAFEAIAAAAAGRLLTTDARVEAVSTPFDPEIAAVQRRIEATVIPFGTRAEQAAVRSQQRSNGALGAEQYAARASYQCKTGTFYGRDLAWAVSEGGLRLEDVAADQLPAGLQGLGPEALAARVRGIQAERAAARAELSRLVQRRDAWVRARGGRSGLDRALLDCIEADCARAGLSFAVAAAPLRHLGEANVLDASGGEQRLAVTLAPTDDPRANELALILAWQLSRYAPDEPGPDGAPRAPSVLVRIAPDLGIPWRVEVGPDGVRVLASDGAALEAALVRLQAHAVPLGRGRVLFPAGTLLPGC